VTDTLRPEYTAEQVAEVVEGLTAIITEPAECWHPTHISRDDIRTVLAEIQRLTLKVESAGAGFTDEELHALSLCAAWTDALSEGKGSDAVHRKPFAKIAMAGFRRVFGEGYHAKLCGRIDAARNQESTNGR